MLDFVARVFRGWMNFLLWLILIGCAIGGFITGGNALGGRGFSFGYGLLGLLIGGFVGLVTVILSGGLIANFLNMVDNIETIKSHLSKTGNTTSGNYSGLNLGNVSPLVVNKLKKKCSRCKKEVADDYSSCPHCGNDSFE
jgi:hypothetical protein